MGRRRVYTRVQGGGGGWGACVRCCSCCRSEDPPGSAKTRIMQTRRRRCSSLGGQLPPKVGPRPPSQIRPPQSGNFVPTARVLGRTETLSLPHFLFFLLSCSWFPSLRVRRGVQNSRAAFLSLTDCWPTCSEGKVLSRTLVGLLERYSFSRSAKSD